MIFQRIKIKILKKIFKNLTDENIEKLKKSSAEKEKEISQI